MAASQAVRSLVSSHGTSQSSSASDDAICDAHLHPHCHFTVDVGCLLERAPVSALTQHHSRFLMVDSSVPLSVCLKAMVEYDRAYALVYEPSLGEVVGCIDECFFLRVFSEEGFNILEKSGKEIMGLEFATTLCKVSEHMSAWDALPLMLNQKYVTHHRKRAFVWSLEKDAPIGCLTPSCYLGYIAKHIYDCDIYTTFEDISSLPERPTVSEDTTLQEVVDVLTGHDTVIVASSTGQVVSVLNRSIIVQYILSVFRLKEPVKLSTSVRTVLHHLDVTFGTVSPLPEINESTLLKDELYNLLYSRFGAVLCVESRCGYSRVITVWDVLRHILHSFGRQHLPR